MNVDIDAYSGRVRATCENALGTALDLRDALQACQGLFPAQAVEQFRAIDRDRTLELLWKQKEDVHQSSPATEEGTSFVLSTWEYSTSSIESLIALSWTGASRVCLIGCPTLAKHLPRAAKARTHLLVDLRTPLELSPDIQHVKYDVNCLTGSEFRKAFDSCFIDPPWYVESYRRWIDIATQYCRPGGLIVFSLMGPLTRPTATGDRQKILEHCARRGLSVQIHEGALLYDVPDFERSMLHRAGIPAVRWKRADLVVAKRDAVVALKSLARATPLPPFLHTNIQRISVDVVFDRYDERPNVRLVTVSDDYWMKSPSRRERGVNECNVFTSNGSRFVSPRPFDLSCELVAISRLDSQSAAKRLVELGFPKDVVDDAFVANVVSARLLS